ncbi:hypothetical protein ACFVWP_46860 [Streptomyces sp. NPDC058175]|uniref:hypothetical protein n=1 Tax=Streptomyces sp. NPDC058175 TaxID=3346367 RepID=UPI0036E90F05
MTTALPAWQQSASYCDGRLVAEPVLDRGQFAGRRWLLDGVHVNPPAVEAFLLAWPGGLELSEAWAWLRVTARAIDAKPGRTRRECIRCREWLAKVLAEPRVPKGQTQLRLRISI